MSTKYFGVSLMKITFVIVFFEVVIRISYLNGKIRDLYESLFSAIYTDADLILLFVVPLVNASALILFVIYSYVFKKTKDFNYQFCIYILFYLLFFISSYIDIILNYKH